MKAQECERIARRTKQYKELLTPCPLRLHGARTRFAGLASYQIADRAIDVGYLMTDVLLFEIEDWADMAYLSDLLNESGLFAISNLGFRLMTKNDDLREGLLAIGRGG